MEYKRNKKKFEKRKRDKVCDRNKVGKVFEIIKEAERKRHIIINEGSK